MDDSLLIEERDGGGVVRSQYVWSPDGHLVLRDRDADGNGTTTSTSLEERLYVQSDAAGSTTSLSSNSGGRR